MDTDRLIRRIQSEISKQVLTQAEVAKMAGISRQRVNAILKWRSRSKPTIRILMRVLKIGEQHAPR